MGLMKNMLKRRLRCIIAIENINGPINIDYEPKIEPINVIQSIKAPAHKEKNPKKILTIPKDNNNSHQKPKLIDSYKFCMIVMITAMTTMIDKEE